MSIEVIEQSYDRRKNVTTIASTMENKASLEEAMVKARRRPHSVYYISPKGYYSVYGDFHKNADRFKSAQS